MSLKRLVKKVGGVIKKVAAPALAIGGSMFLPGIGGKIGGALGGAISKIGSSAKSVMGSAWGPSLIGAAGGLAGDIYSGKAAAENSQQQMAFQERMSSTAHQREVADLRAAGLNPMLSGTGGAGSSSPAGSAAPVPDYGDRLVQAANLKLVNAQAENVDADTRAKNQNYQFERYFQPRERMAAMQSGKSSYKAQQIAIETARQGLQNLKQDFEAKKLSVSEATQILEAFQDSEYFNYYTNPGYADQSKIDRLLENGDISSGINLLLQIFKSR